MNGFVKVKPLSGEVEHLLKLTSVTLRQDGRERLLDIKESAAAGSSALIRFAGYDSPEAAKALSGAELLVSRNEAAPLLDGEFYVEDLKGLAAISVENGEKLGHITAIIEGGGGDLAEIRLNDGQTRLVPFREEFFTGIEPDKGQVLLKNLWVLE
ncbi:MAG: ribosome maturation factor RimM [Treponema sp.]|nr:ribosome maturation factor RimM [Treponema sp.]